MKALMKLGSLSLSIGLAALPLVMIAEPATAAATITVNETDETMVWNDQVALGFRVAIATGVSASAPGIQSSPPSHRQNSSHPAMKPRPFRTALHLRLRDSQEHATNEKFTTTEPRGG